MYKGNQKRMIAIKDPGSKYFEEAYFIMKEDRERDESEIKDMIEEANRIIENGLKKKRPARFKAKYALYAMSGAGVCSLIVSIVLFIIK